MRERRYRGTFNGYHEASCGRCNGSRARISFDLSFALVIDPAGNLRDDPSVECRSWQGIYAIEGDTLKICFGMKDRPKSFAAKADSGHILFLFEKPKKLPDRGPTPLPRP
jgi:hypothetical protein